MNTFSSVTIVGRLTKDAEMRMTAGENSNTLVRFSLAVNRRKRDNSTGEYVDEANFFNVSYFGKNAGNICVYLQKGVLVGVVGELTQRRFQNAEGKDVSLVEVNASNVHLIESKSMREQAQGQMQGQGSQQFQQGQTSQFHQSQFQSQTRPNQSVQPNNQHPVEKGISPDDFAEDDIPF